VSACGWRRTGKGALVGVVVTVEHGIVGVGQQRWLTTVSRAGGGGLVAVPSGEEAKGRKCGRVRV
jgi:hypothetical protein